MANAIAGTAFIKYNGKQLALRGNLKISPFLFEREGIAGADGVHGYKEMYRMPMMEMDITDRGDLNLSEIQDITDATITAELVNGKVYILRNAWVKNAIELDAIEGQFSITFEGLKGEELLESNV